MTSGVETFGAVEAMLVALSGGVGAATRYGIDLGVTGIARRFGRGTRGFPWGITLVNLSGSFLLGMFLGAGLDAGPWWPAISTGLLGGFTTFSTASLDTVRLIREKHLWLAAINAFGTLGAAILLASAGIAVGIAVGIAA